MQQIQHWSILPFQQAFSPCLCAASGELQAAYHLIQEDNAQGASRNHEQARLHHKCTPLGTAARSKALQPGLAGKRGAGSPSRTASWSCQAEG